MVNPTAMPRPKSDKDSQVTIVLPGAWLDEAERMADARSEPGHTVTRADVLRMAIRRGLEALKAESPPERKRGGRK